MRLTTHSISATRSARANPSDCAGPHARAAVFCTFGDVTRVFDCTPLVRSYSDGGEGRPPKQYTFSVCFLPRDFPEVGVGNATLRGLRRGFRAARLPDSRAMRRLRGLCGAKGRTRGAVRQTCVAKGLQHRGHLLVRWSADLPSRAMRHSRCLGGQGAPTGHS